MLTTAIALLIVVQGRQQDSNGGDKLSAAQLVGRVFEKYSKADSVAGSIKCTQTAQNATVITQTDLQFDRPGKIYLYQTRTGSKGRQWLLVSDGKIFSYDRPATGGDIEFGKLRRTEAVTQHDFTQKIQDLYMAAEHSLGDLNAMLDVAISSNSRLSRLKGQWATLGYKGKIKAEDGRTLQVVGGNWRDSENVPSTGQYLMYFTEDSEFVKYETSQSFAFPTVSKEPVIVHTVWESTLKIGAKTDPALYKVIQ